jgi:hypothetical protein
MYGWRLIGTAFPNFQSLRFGAHANDPFGREVFLIKSDEKDDMLLPDSSCDVFWIYSDTEFAKFKQSVPFKKNPCVKK